MHAEFETVHNYHERAVFAAVTTAARRFPQLRNPQLLADIACVALNKLPARYIRHPVDLAFYLTEKEHLKVTRDIEKAVTFAFEFVQARQAMRARG